MRIITLTLNPAFDVHCCVENFKPYHESIAEISSVEAGGKGVNVSRALISNGIDNTAVVIVGKENGNEFCKMLEKEGLNVSAVFTDGRIRENITLHESKNPETRISFHGFKCDKNILAEVEEKIGKVGSSVITFTGSIPKGIACADVLALLKKFKDEGAKIVIDCRSVSLKELVDFKPWLIKPNEDEIFAYTGKKIFDVRDAGEIAKKLFLDGIENVMISLGKSGAVLACKDGVFYSHTPEVEVLSTIGAGDSAIAGFIDGYLKWYKTSDILKRATSYGTAACLREGTKPPLPYDVVKIEKAVNITKSEI